MNNDQTTQKIQELETKLNLLSSKFSSHFHDGNNSQRVNLTDLFGLIQCVGAVPTGIPRGAFQQVKIYSSGTTYRLYVYDTISNTWRYTALT